MTNTETLEDLVSLDLRAFQSEVRNLRAIEAWALASLDIDYKPGDRIEITSERPAKVGGGWEGYAEALAVGRTGIAGEITFNAYKNGWYVLFGMDRCWSTSSHEKPVRYWSGPADETPEGYVPPSAYDQEKFPDGRMQYFAMPVSWVRKVSS